MQIGKFGFKKLGSLLYVMCVCVGVIFAQTELSNLNTTWSTVLGGEVICKPETTSYGIICVTDGKTISSISNNGVILWEKRITGVNSSSFIKTISDDFIVAITNSNKKITLYNPSGVGLWTKNTDWEIIEKPFEGRDGRFFLRGKQNLCCYGINGICKWEIKTDTQSSIPLQELPDGSLIVFLKELSDGKTKAIRVSPFGKILEEITFAGEVVTSDTRDDGVFLTFTDGSAGLFSLEKNKAVNKWVLNSVSYKKDKNNFFVTDKKSNTCYFLTANDNGIKAYKIDSKTGKVKSDFLISDLKIENVIECSASQNGLFIMDSENAVFYTSNDKLSWNGKLPDKKKSKWIYPVFTQTNELVITYKNWTIDAYRVLQNVTKSIKTVSKKSYNSYYTIDTTVYETIYKYNFNNNLISDDRIMSLRAGFYGDKEIVYVSEMESALKAYTKNLNSSNFGTRIEKSIFETNSSSMEKMFSELPYFGTDEFAHQTSRLILLEKNQTLLNTLLLGIQKNGYDPDGEILNAIEQLANSKSTISPFIADSICDAVYSICRFMGRPAFNKSGKQILQKFLSSNSSTKARDTLKALSELEM